MNTTAERNGWKAFTFYFLVCTDEFKFFLEVKIVDKKRSADGGKYPVSKKLKFAKLKCFSIICSERKSCIFFETLAIYELLVFAGTLN